MITINNLTWSNWFSYGENNHIDFEQPVLQIMGKNGTGKTSIPLILQEVFYGKNSKGKKKASLPNRYLTKPVVTATCNFLDDAGNQYKIDLNRKTTLKLSLSKNGKDISSHTTTATYKTIQDIIGLDFKTFAQLIYQSSTDKLEFLTATDANRKKFLITLFALDKYIGINEQFKKVAIKLNFELTAITSKISTIESWVTDHEKMDFTIHDIEDLPEINNDDIDELGDIRSSLNNITETNKRINRNNQYKEMLNSVDTSILYDLVPSVDKKAKAKLISGGKEVKEDLIRHETKLKLLASTKSKIFSLDDKCHSCGQDIAEELKTSMIQDVEAEEDSLTSLCVELNDTLVAFRTDLKIMQDTAVKAEQKEKVSTEVSRLTTSIDNSIQTDVLDEKELKDTVARISTRIDNVKLRVDKISRENRIAAAHNSKVDVVLEQLEEHRSEISSLKNTADDMSKILHKVEIIKKAFSPSGLLSYKIDYLVKDLEKEINEYLGTLSGGKFQLIFKLENEKLNIEIIDEGMSVGIEELSAGELARINAATLLAIRKLMAAISSTKINILFLDEILAVLDDAGKEMLIEVLHKETDINTLLVSHEWSHPLIPKITVYKEDKISKIGDY